MLLLPNEQLPLTSAVKFRTIFCVYQCNYMKRVVMNMIKFSLAIATLALITGCSSSNDTEQSSGNAQAAGSEGSEGIVLIPDTMTELPTQRYPSDAELAASNGVPDLDGARALIQGSWSDTNPATQCVTNYQIDGAGVFSTTGSDRFATGTYDLDIEGGDLVMFEAYSSENFGTDCFGEIAPSDSLEPQVFFIFDIAFPDQNTMEFLSGPEAFHTFVRQ